VKILVADDDPVTRRTLRSLVEHLGHELLEAEDGHAAWALIDQPDAPALILLDWMMPGPDGVEICRRLRAAGKHRHSHVLMISARDTTEDLVEGLDAGADGYIRKPFDLREVRAHVRAAERLLIARDELRAQSITDELTAALNRRGFLERVQHELALVARDGRDLAVLMIDVDHFKAVNDTHGHSAGDEVLREITSRMRLQLRAYDDLGRLGGEEFGVLLPACTVTDAVTVAERLRESIASPAVVTRDAAVTVTVSVGVVSVDTLGKYDAADVLAKADRALYAAKSGGRNRVEVDFAAPGIAVTSR
jgi:two-component system, cell cycle response regulator